MHLPGNSIIKKLIIVLLALAVITMIAYFSVAYFNSRTQNQLYTEISSDFLSFIESGNLESSGSLWPQVYTSKKDDNEFLEKFSSSLQKIYLKYYTQTYIENNKNPDAHEICRLYYDFISVEKFNTTADAIYSDYFNEIIDYADFISAENDLFAFSKLTSSYIPRLLNDGTFINESREVYSKAIETAASEDYSNAIELMRSVSPLDTIYYPKAIDKIDEYIISLKEQVKNGS